VASDINSTTVVGRLTRDAETRTVGDKTVAAYAIASNYYAKDKPDAVNFFDVDHWQPGGVLPYLKKGAQVVINGELRQERWTKDGVNHSKIKIMVHRLQLVGGKQQGRDPDAIGQSVSYDDEAPF
jgi:single-strand DNA-binding protein